MARLHPKFQKPSTRINLLEIPHNTRKVALMKEKLEFAVFKLERITHGYSQYVTLEEQAAAHHLYLNLKYKNGKTY